MELEQLLLAMNEPRLALLAEHLDGRGSIQHPLVADTFDAALATWQRLLAVAPGNEWCWSIATA